MFLRESIQTKEKIDQAFSGENKQYIKLNGFNIKDEDISYVLSKPCKDVKRLQIQINSLTDTGIHQLASANLNLTLISLFRNNITHEGCRMLTLAPWKSLQSIILSYNKIGDKGIKILTRGNWSELKYLGLSSCNISDHGLSHLNKGQWKGLQRLKLGDNNLSKGCFENLIKGNWKGLQTVDISWNQVRYQGIIKVFACDWESLRQLWLRYNKAQERKRGLKHLSTMKFKQTILIQT